MERRGTERHRVWFPIAVVTDGGEVGTAITFDVSATGLLMACPGPLAVDQHVTLRFRVSPADAEERALAARIVRVEENGAEDGPWRYRMAVSFDEPHPELEGLLEMEEDA
jgi:hypothetical protein